MWANLRAVLRLLHVLGLIIKAVWVVRFQFGPATRLSPLQRQNKIHEWAHQVLSALGIQLHTNGPGLIPKSGPLLLLANHVSWLDIILVLATIPARFISKAELHHWPILGSMVAGAGTLFIERESNRDVMRVVHQMKDALLQNDMLMVFPEGTTSTGETVLPFHGNLIQAAISAACPIQTIALQYLELQEPVAAAHSSQSSQWQLSQAAPYVGDDTLLGSVWRIAKANSIRAELAFAEPQTANGRSRREWAHDLQQQVVGQLAKAD